MSIAIVTDSTCDLPREILERYSVTVLPLHITRGNESLLDGLEITPEDIFAHVAAGGDICATSAVNISEFADCFRSLGRDHEAVICLTIGASFSTCYQNACVAAGEMQKPRVHVVDSQSLSSGQGLLVLAAARLAEEGLAPEEIVRRLEKARERVDASFILDRLDYMKKGGRCSAVAALGANLLKLKPCIEVKNGKMTVGKKYRGSLTRVMEQYTRDRLAAYAPNACGDVVVVVHPPADKEPLEAARRVLEEDGRFSHIWEAYSGCTVACHCGPNTIGVMFLPTGESISENACGVSALKHDPACMARLYDRGYQDGEKILPFLDAEN